MKFFVQYLYSIIYITLVIVGMTVAVQLHNILLYILSGVIVGAGIELYGYLAHKYIYSKN